MADIFNPFWNRPRATAPDLYTAGSPLHTNIHTYIFIYLLRRAKVNGSVEQIRKDVKEGNVELLFRIMMLVS